jgi:hypothetical protein
VRAQARLPAKTGPGKEARACENPILPGLVEPSTRDEARFFSNSDRGP